MTQSIWEERYREMRSRSSFEARKRYIDQFRFNEFPLADAYEAALFMYKRVQYRRGLLEETRPESPYFYRGLSDQGYSLTPTIFRGEDQAFEAELDRLSSLVRYLEAELVVSEPRIRKVSLEPRNCPCSFDGSLLRSNRRVDCCSESRTAILSSRKKNHSGNYMPKVTS